MSVPTEEQLGDVVALNLDDPALDLGKAKDAAKVKAKEFCKDPMLLSWKNGKTGAFYPNFECGSSDRPAWVVFAEARGCNLTIDVNDGEFVFIYLKLAENPDQIQNPHTPDRDWIGWLSDRLSFPFEVVRIDDDDKFMVFGGDDSEPFRIDHKMKVLAVESEEDLYGVIIKVLHHSYTPFQPRINFAPYRYLEIHETRLQQRN